MQLFKLTPAVDPFLHITVNSRMFDVGTAVFPYREFTINDVAITMSVYKNNDKLGGL